MRAEGSSWWAHAREQKSVFITVSLRLCKFLSKNSSRITAVVGKMSLCEIQCLRGQLGRVVEHGTCYSAAESPNSSLTSSAGFAPTVTPTGSCETALPWLPSPQQHPSWHADPEYCPKSVSEHFFHFPLLACLKHPPDVKSVGSCNMIDWLLISFFLGALVVTF